MSLSFTRCEHRSPLVASVTHGWTLAAGSARRPAEICWHLVCVRVDGKRHMILSGPLSASGVANWGAGAEIVWVKFKPGVYLPHLPPRMLRDKQVALSEAGDLRFRLNGFALSLPGPDDIDALVGRMLREDLLRHDPLPEALLAGRPTGAIAPRTLRHRVLHATGLSPNNLLQYERAMRAGSALSQGLSIADTVFAHGYYDQAHLARALRRWVGATPATLAADGR